MDKKVFFDGIRGKWGSLSQTQVDGINYLLNEGERRRSPLEEVAYILATAKHETANTYQPITERGDRAYFDKYEPGTSIGKTLGNTVKGDGYKFRGRGYVQLTGRRNYKYAGAKLGKDLETYPDLALQPNYAAHICFSGMEEGWFTGKKISDYLDETDESDQEDLREFIEARRIINGTDKAQTIGNYALIFEKALRAAKWGDFIPDVPAPEPKPETKPPVYAPEKTGLIAFLIRSMLQLMGKSS